MKKTAVQILFCLIVIMMTMGYLLRGGGFARFIQDLMMLRPADVLLAFTLLMGYILLESVIIKVIMYSLDEEVSMLQCCKYSFIGFFFYCITPAGSGEQPSQLYAMHKDGLSTAKSLFALTLITITFKLAIVVLGVCVYVFKPEEVMRMIAPISPLCILGLILSAGCVVLFICLLWIPSNIEKLAKLVIMWLGKIGVLHDTDKYVHMLSDFMKKYEETVDECLAQKPLPVVVLLITVAQRVCLLAITAVMALATGHARLGLASVVSVQGMVQLGTEMLPLPGGAGANELMFLRAFRPAYGHNTLSVLMLSRGVSFYGQLIICGIMSLIIAVAAKMKRGNK